MAESTKNFGFPDSFGSVCKAESVLLLGKGGWACEIT
jgi:hypothetical protein